MGCANDIGMGPRWVQIWGPYGTFLGQHGPYVDNHYGSQMGFANDIGMGPIWVQIWGPYGTFLGQHGPYVGNPYGAQIGLASDIGMGPIWVQIYNTIQYNSTLLSRKRDICVQRSIKRNEKL